MGAAADYLAFKAFKSTTCGGDPLSTVALFIDGKVECINSTSWKNSPNGQDQGFICEYPSKDFGTASSFLCYTGKYNHSKPLVGANLLTLPNRDSCSQQFNGFQQFTPGACILNGPDSAQVLCDNNGVTYSRFRDTTCVGIESYPYGCNLSTGAYFQISACSGFPHA